MDKNIFYNYDKIVSYNALLNLIIGERGVGKTYGAKLYCINRFISKHKQFVYIRRYDSDLSASVGNTNNDKFFEQVKKEFPDHNFTIAKNKKVRILKMDGEIIGYALPLSSADSLKSSSYENVDTIIYDEFMLKDGSKQRYLNGEPEVILDLIETIGRLRDIKVFCLGNAVSTTCPLMSYFNLTLPYGGEFKTFNDGLIVVNYVKNIAYREVKKQSRFGKLIAGTNYARYAIDNEFVNESRDFIKKKNNKAKYYYTLVINLHEFGVWYNGYDDVIYLSDDVDKSCMNKFAIHVEDHTEATLLVRAKTNPYFQAIVVHFRSGKLYFENMKLKNCILENLYKYLI